MNKLHTSINLIKNNIADHFIAVSIAAISIVGISLGLIFSTSYKSNDVAQSNNESTPSGDTAYSTPLITPGSNNSDSTTTTTPENKKYITLPGLQSSTSANSSNAYVHPPKESDPTYEKIEIETEARTTVITTTTAPNPWIYPFILSKMYADCKEEVIRQGFSWNDTLNQNNARWGKPVSTFSTDAATLKSMTFKMISAFKGSEYRNLNVFITPDDNIPNNYLIYCFAAQ